MGMAMRGIAVATKCLLNVFVLENRIIWLMLVLIRQISAIIVVKLFIWKKNGQRGVAENGYDEKRGEPQGASVGKTVEKKEKIKKKTSIVKKVADKDSD